jgi:HECT-domain (ubiquitin-transferase)
VCFTRLALLCSIILLCSTLRYSSLLYFEAHACNGDHLVNFRFVGRLLGRALFDQQMVKGHLVPFLYKHILGVPVTMLDLADQDKDYYLSLGKLRDVQCIESLYLDFTVTENRAGVPTLLELLPQGESKAVTKHNLGDYYRAVLKHRLLEQAKPQLTELLLGFYDVVPEMPLSVFDSTELELTLCGLPTIDVEDWKANTRYSGSLVAKGQDDTLVRWFWEIVDEFDNESRARLLQFTTGSSGVSPSGFASLRGADGAYKSFAIHGTDGDAEGFPKAQ